ncbi:tyrosine--tRNA ligase [Malassezia sp. CBS 17886]|nr:tyrosine--tRNA ligase [Malassezia sp. CBS 17886]
MATHDADGSLVRRTVYSGVDPSAPSLHVGNLLPLMALLHCALHGHTALVLIGGATGAVGDPSGRSAERSALDADRLTQNAASIRAQVRKFFHSAAAYLSKRGQLPGSQVRASGAHGLGDAPCAGGAEPAGTAAAAAAPPTGEPLVDAGLDVRMLNNLDWFRHLSVLDFLGGVGRHARVGDMMARDSVKSRLAPGDVGPSAGLSFTEFSYQLMQAHDYSVLHGAPWHCSLQLGGSDQMGNIQAGIDLIRRQRAAAAERTSMRADPAYGLTLPLLTTASGAKFGKSAGNAVWLAREQLSDLDFFQYFFRSADADVAIYLRTLTLLDCADIDAVLNEHAAAPSRRLAQTRLAEEVIELARGPDALRRAQLATRVLFSTDVHTLAWDDVAFAFHGDPRLVTVPRDALGADILRLAVDAGLVPSKGDARRLMQQGGLYVNDAAVRDPAFTLQAESLLDGRFVILRAGKTNHKIVAFL